MQRETLYPFVRFKEHFGAETMYSVVRVIPLLAGLLLMAGSANAQVGNNPGLMDPNLADAKALRSLPNVSAAAARAIEDARPIKSAAELDRALSGLLSGTERTELYRRLFRQLNLNSAGRKEIMLIPGMTRRMAHEFEEYRPYTSLEQFRREIGKYVDADEVARLEQYVFIPIDLNSASRKDLMTIPGMTKRMAHEFEEYRPYRDMEQFRREIGKYVDEREVARLESYVSLDR